MEWLQQKSLVENWKIILGGIATIILWINLFQKK